MKFFSLFTDDINSFTIDLQLMTSEDKTLQKEAKPKGGLFLIFLLQLVSNILSH